MSDNQVVDLKTSENLFNNIESNLEDLYTGMPIGKRRDAVKEMKDGVCKAHRKHKNYYTE